MAEENKPFELEGIIKDVHNHVHVGSSGDDLVVLMMDDEGVLYTTFKTINDYYARNQLYDLLHNQINKRIKAKLMKFESPHVSEGTYYKVVSNYQLPKKNNE